MTQPWIGQVCHPIYARISTCLWQHSVWTTRCVCKGLGLQAVTNDFIHLLHFFLLIPHSFLFWFQDLFTYLFWWWIYFPLTTTHSMIPSIVESLPSVATIVFLVPSCYTISFACKRQDKRLLFSTCKCVFPHWFRRQPNIHLLPRLFYSPPNYLKPLLLPQSSSFFLFIFLLSIILLHPLLCIFFFAIVSHTYVHPSKLRYLITSSFLYPTLFPLIHHHGAWRKDQYPRGWSSPSSCAYCWRIGKVWCLNRPCRETWVQQYWQGNWTRLERLPDFQVPKPYYLPIWCKQTQLLSFCWVQFVFTNIEHRFMLEMALKRPRWSRRSGTPTLARMHFSRSFSTAKSSRGMYLTTFGIFEIRH